MWGLGREMIASRAAGASAITALAVSTSHPGDPRERTLRV